MKTSFKLLIGSFLIIVATMFGAAISLRRQYDSIDKTDTYARWKKVTLPAFRVVQLSGPSPAMVQIQPGKTTRLLVDTLRRDEQQPYQYRVERDTLFMTVGLLEGWQFRPEDEDDEIQNARLVVEVPALTAVSTSNANCQIVNYKGEALALQQTGKGGRTLLDNVTFGQLTASLSGRNQLTIAAINNKISQAAITLRDSARLHQYKDFQKGLILTASPAASLHLTGQALAQATK